MKPFHVAVVFLCCLSLMHLHSLFTISSQMTFYSQVAFLRDASKAISDSEKTFNQAAQEQLDALNSANFYVGMAMMVSMILILSISLLTFTQKTTPLAPAPDPVSLPPPSVIRKRKQIPKKKEEKEEEKGEGKEKEEEKGEVEAKAEGEVEEEEGEEEGEEGAKTLPEPPFPHMTPRPKHPFDMGKYKDKYEQLEQRTFDITTRELYDTIYADNAPCSLPKIIHALGDTEIESTIWGGDTSRAPLPEKIFFTRDIISRKGLPPNPFGNSSTRIFRHQVIQASPDWSSFECRTVSASVDAPFGNDFLCEDNVIVSPTHDGNTKVTYRARVVFDKKPWMFEGRIRAAALEGMKLTAVTWLNNAEKCLQ